MANIIVGQLLFLESESDTLPIKMYIHSPGGEIGAGLAIYDTMQHVRAPVSTVALGNVCSMASVLLAAGRPGMRRALPSSFIMLHQPHGSGSGQG